MAPAEALEDCRQQIADTLADYRRWAREANCGRTAPMRVHALAKSRARMADLRVLRAEAARLAAAVRLAAETSASTPPVYAITSEVVHTTLSTETLEGTYAPGVTQQQLFDRLSNGLGGTVLFFRDGRYTFRRNTD